MRKFKEGDKFILEVSHQIGSDPDVYITTKGNTIMGSSLENLEKYDDIINQAAYEAGLQAAYESGLNDAWEAVKKITLGYPDGGIPSDDLFKIFGSRLPCDIFKDFNINSILKNIKEYEEEKEVRVGDVLRNKRSKDFRVVFLKYLGSDEFDSIEISPADHISVVHGINLSNGWEKTGEHYDLEELFDIKKE